MARLAERLSAPATTADTLNAEETLNATRAAPLVATVVVTDAATGREMLGAADTLAELEAAPAKGLVSATAPEAAAV